MLEKLIPQRWRTDETDEQDSERVETSYSIYEKPEYSDPDYEFPIKKERSDYDLRHIETETGFEVFVGAYGGVWIANENGEQIGDDDTANHLDKEELERIRQAARQRRD